MTHVRVNLIPGVILEHRAERRWRLRWGIAVVSAAALVALGTAGLRVGSDAGVRSARGDVARLKAQLTDIGSDLERMRGLMARARAEAGAATRLSDRPDWGRLLATLDAHRAERVTIVRVDLGTLAADGTPAEPGGGSRVSITLEGVGRDLASAQAYALALEESGLFDRVSPMRTGPVTIGSRACVSFELDADLWGEARVAEVTP